MRLYRTTIEVWSTERPYTNETGAILRSLANMQDGVGGPPGRAYVAVEKTETIENPRSTTVFNRLRRMCAIGDWFNQFET